MASTERLPSGKYRGIYQDADRKKRRVPGTFDRKTDAYDAAVDAQAKAKRRAAVTAGTLSPRTPWGQWWEVFSKDRHPESDTGFTEASIAKLYLLPKWEAEPLNSITRGLVQGWVDELTPGKKPGYVHRIYAPFSASITAAVKGGILDASPCAGVTLPKVQRRSKAYATTADAEALGPELDEHYRDAVDFGLETGLRPGELTGLHVARVDLANGWMTVAETYVFHQKRMRAWPKDKDERVVPLTSKAIEIVKRRIGDRDVNSPCGVPHIGGSKCPGALVFLGKRAGILSRDLLNFHMSKAADAAKVARKSGYSLRRGFITRAAEGGLDVFTLADIAGHEDVKQTKEYFQKTPTVRGRMLAALGERPTLKAVDGVGRDGHRRGTDPSGQSGTDRPTGSAEEAG